MSYIQITAFGNLTRDVEIKNQGTEKAVCSFSIASNRKLGGEEKVTYLDCKAFGKTADNIAKFFTKGSRIIIRSGELEQERWTDKTTGAERSKLTCILGGFDFPEKASRNGDDADHGEREARENFRAEPIAPAKTATADYDEREARSAAKQAPVRQQQVPGITVNRHHDSDEDVPY